MTALARQQPSLHSLSTPRPHQSLARRLLFPNHSGDLPPLLASNVSPELQAELYDFLALALRAYVNPWWTKLTRYDKEFLPQLSQTLTVLIRAIEVRVLALDLATLALQDLPMILTQHYRDYRNVASKLSSSYATGGAASLPQLFHCLQPHIALSADGNIDLGYYRQIVDHILKACLPPEDYAPEAERLIVREVIVKVLVNDVIPKITQPWFLQNLILDLLGSSEAEDLFQPPAHPTGTSFSFHTLIIVVLSALQSFSSTCLALTHAYKHAISTIKLVNQSPMQTPRSTSPTLPLPAAREEIRSSSSTPQPQTLPTSQSHPPSISPTPSTKSSVSYPSRSAFPHSLREPRATPSALPQYSNTQQHPSQQPPQVQYVNYASATLALITEIFLTQDRFAATTLMHLFWLASASMTAFLDKLLPYLLYTALSAGFVLNMVKLTKKVMFPNGYPGPPPLEPTMEEQKEIRERLVRWRGSGGLSRLLPLLLGNDLSHVLGRTIDPLTSQPCNVHLVVVLLDRIIVGLFPELIGDGNGGQGANDEEMHDDTML